MLVIPNQLLVFRNLKVLHDVFCRGTRGGKHYSVMTIPFKASLLHKLPHGGGGEASLE
jgi:hypothetical protein